MLLCIFLLLEDNIFTYLTGTPTVTQTVLCMTSVTLWKLEFCLVIKMLKEVLAGNGGIHKEYSCIEIRNEICRGCQINGIQTPWMPAFKPH